jgi:hypothetical protein
MRINEILNKNLLLEIDFYDKSTLVPILKKYKEKWIHFTNGVKHRVATDYFADSTARNNKEIQKVKKFNRKVGDFWQQEMKINYNSHHRDPKGIYFYPCSYLLTGAERILSNNQYGLNMRYFYVCDIDMSSYGFNLGTVSWEDIFKLAERNGWKKDLDDFLALPIEEQKKKLPRYVKFDIPGSVLWAFVDWNNNNEAKRDKAYAGLNWIYDPDKSIIHNHEPHQILVLNPSIVKVIYSSENKDVITDPVEKQFSSLEAKKLHEWKYFLISFFKKVRGEYGTGNIIWKYKIPKLEFKIEDTTFEVSLDTKYSSEWGIVMKSKRGYIDGYYIISKNLEYEKRTSDELFEVIDKNVRRLISYKNPLIKNWAKGIFEGKDVQAACFDILQNHIFSPGGENKTETNVSDSESPEYVDVVFRNTHTNEFAEYRKVETKSYISFYRQNEYTLYVQSTLITGKTTIYGAPLNKTIGGIRSFSFPIDKPIDYKEIAQKYADDLRKNLQEFAPKVRSPNDFYSVDSFVTDDEYQAFLGYTVLNCGVSFNGELVKFFTNEIKKFNDMNKDKFIQTIAQKVRS